ncbi:hypothetical protein IAD21_06140 [Abditibacteriota bacterium]|nr:hypothetical protein IAD21_06140 [Abditibacteriota bacterium]
MKLSTWRLASKFNLVFLLVFAISIAGAGAIFNAILQQQARQIVTGNARLMMENALAIRKYTSKQIQPILPTDHNGRFVAQTVPAYSAKQSFEYLRKQYPDFFYREAVLNPTNPDDVALAWEANIVSRFQKGDEKEIVGMRDTPQGRYFYMSRPLRVTEQSCLKCHSVPSVAPAAMIRDYGDKRGFNWKLHSVIGAQVVSVPVSVPERMARNVTALMMGSLAGILLVTLVILNLMLRQIVVAPVKKLAHSADEISKGNLEVEDLPVNGQDEIAVLSGSFNRMQRSLKQAIQMLDE